MQTRSICDIMQDAMTIQRRLRAIPAGNCRWARLAAIRLDSARYWAGRGHAGNAAFMLQEAEVAAGYSEAHAHLRTLRSEASAEAARSFHA